MFSIRGEIGWKNNSLYRVKGLKFLENVDIYGVDIDARLRYDNVIL
jgi:hypothetical protein